MRLWDIVRDIIVREEVELLRRVEIPKLKIPVEVSKVTSVSERTLSEPWELYVDGIGYVEVIIIKTTDTNWRLTVRTEQGLQYYNATFSDLQNIALGNPMLDAQDRTAVEGFYFVAIKKIKFLEEFSFIFTPTPSTYVKLLYVLYYVMR